MNEIPIPLAPIGKIICDQQDAMAIAAAPPPGQAVEILKDPPIPVEFIQARRPTIETQQVRLFEASTADFKKAEINKLLVLPSLQG